MAACGDNDEKADSPIVWFSDSNQPYITLSHLVLRGKTPRAWYWHTLLPQLSGGMNSKQIFEALMIKAHSTSSGNLTITEIIERLISSNLTDEFFQFLTVEIAEYFLFSDGINHDTSFSYLLLPPNSFPFEIPIPPNWRDTIFRALATWGTSDPRTIWLTYNAMVRKNPSLVRSSQTVQLIKQVVTGFSILLRDKQSVSNTKESPTQLDQNTLEPREGFSSDHTAFHGTDSNILRPSPSNIKSTTSHKVPEDKPVRMTDHTSYSGLVFLIRFLEILGIKEILQAHPKLALINFPAVVLRSLVDRFKVPQKDPIRRFLPDSIPIEDRSIQHFIAPSQWLPIVFDSNSRPKVIHKHIFSSKKKAIIYTDSGNVFALGVYSKNDNFSFPAELKAHILEINYKHDFIFNIQNLIMTFHFLLGKLARKFASMSLRAIIHRKGKVSITKTHLDLLLNSDTADVRIRRSGIDIDPGWVSWLGKIVQYHYESGEAYNAQIR